MQAYIQDINPINGFKCRVCQISLIYLSINIIGYVNDIIIWVSCIAYIQP